VYNISVDVENHVNITEKIITKNEFSDTCTCLNNDNEIVTEMKNEISKQN